ncbi:eta DNA polymerase [Phellopilus nigrolimitatus]|nr:eta DNA polymerase [Phellopilus nigrolimitatus]
MSTVPNSPSKKGKLKAFSSDFDDLDPTLTYRHILSPTIGPKHPLRVVALCDCNAFYANCEQVRLGIDPETPLVVLQWGMLIAVNYPARSFGISRMDKVDEARKRCPDLVVVHVATYAEGENEPKYWEKPDIKTHKVSWTYIVARASRFIQCSKNYYPREKLVRQMYLNTSDVCLRPLPEKASIDEAFIDFSIPVRDTLLKRYPFLAQLPSDAPNGLDTPLPPPPRISCLGLGNLVPVDPSILDPEKKVTTELVEELEKDGPVTWHDVGLAIAAELMANMRKEVHEKLGYLTSAGIARNKFLSKLVASYRKFNTQNILRNSAIPGFLKPMPFQKIRFLGGKLGKALAGEYDVSTVGDLLSITLDEMQNKFGECSVWVYEILRGIDRSEVKEKPVINKSMNASKNLPKPITKASEGPHWIRMLAAELAIRLIEAREKTPGLWPRTLCLHVRQGWNILRSKQQPFPRPRPVTIDLVTDEAGKLWKEIVGNDMLWDGKEMKVTHLSLGLTGINWTEEGQQGIAGFFHAKIPTGAGRAASEGMAGPSTLTGASRTKRQRSASATPSVKEEETVVFKIDDDYDLDEPETSEFHSFTCSRCHKTVSLPPQLRNQISNIDADDDIFLNIRETNQHALANLRIEHEDYHFAQDLARREGFTITAPSSSGKPNSKSSSPSRPAKKRKKQKEPEGIAKFFTKKAKS